MRKFIFGFIAVVIVGIIIANIPRTKKEINKSSIRDSIDREFSNDEESFYIETMSDKDIYFKADTVLPNNPVINDMMDLANGYAILGTTYCDAELWFRFGVHGAS